MTRVCNIAKMPPFVFRSTAPVWSRRIIRVHYSNRYRSRTRPPFWFLPGPTLNICRRRRLEIQRLFSALPLEEPCKSLLFLSSSSLLLLLMIIITYCYYWYRTLSTGAIRKTRDDSSRRPRRRRTFRHQTFLFKRIMNNFNFSVQMGYDFSGENFNPLPKGLTADRFRKAARGRRLFAFRSRSIEKHLTVRFYVPLI